MKNSENKYWSNVEESNSASITTTPEVTNAPSALGKLERRDFLKVMGASLLLAGVGCSRRPVEKLIPYVNKPAEVNIGSATWYASTCQACSVGCGIVIKTREGRPIKLEGNRDHPLNKGGLCSNGQASILNLYYPGRLKNSKIKSGGRKSDFQNVALADLDSTIASKLNEIKGKPVYVLTGASSSPTSNQVIADFLANYNGGKHISFDATHPEEVAVAQELFYGKKLTPRYRFENAEYILSFGADFLGSWLSPVEFSKGFSKGRQVSNGKMSRLVTIESVVSLTGMNADEHLAVKPGDEVRAALSVAYEVSQILSNGSELRSQLAPYAADKISAELGVNSETIKKIAKEISGFAGKSLVVGGVPHTSNALALELAVNALNSLLGNDGVTVDYQSESHQVASSISDVVELISKMNNGEVSALIIQDANPAFTLPASFGFVEALEKVPLVITFAESMNETAELSDVVVADTHYLESWNDASPQAGLYSLVQPTILPLYEARSFQETLLKWSGNTSDWLSYLKNSWKEKVFARHGSGSFENFWNETLQKGFFDSRSNPDAELSRRGGNTRALTDALSSIQVPAAGFALALYPSIPLGDGRFANNAWLQELPDPVSKVSWDNYASLSPKAATELRVKDGDVISVSTGNLNVELPVLVQPLMHAQSVAIAIGYGRTKVGEPDKSFGYGGQDIGVVGEGVGQNVQALQSLQNGSLNWSAAVNLRKTGKVHRLAITQGHHRMENRPIVMDATLKEFQENPKAGIEGHHEFKSIWKEWEYKGYRWAMTIDLTTCTGCNSCMIGCQSENNVPVVGREQILKGRDMHWLRIDRYYKGDVDHPEVVFQPMLCQHCENAPCETVCPVLATVHDADGLNTMIYNRCVGTRYCLNNCPYKVRRFNYFNYQEEFVNPLNLALNPDITTRSQGVMEKCTFCIQRIRVAKDVAKDENRKVRDGEIQTACQQSCPTDAIQFGDINDEKSQVHRLYHSERSYTVLSELNTKPMIGYLTKIRNKEAS